MRRPAIAFAPRAIFSAGICLGPELSIEEIEENNVRWLKRRIGEVGH
jgi:hypothetical protein